jgi:hypothetical protein
MPRLRLRALPASVVTIGAKQTQFPAGSGDPRSPGRGAIMPNEPKSGSNRAKRTQFRAAAGGGRRKTCKTKPNLGKPGYVGKGRRRVGALGRGVKRAKRTQLGPAGGQMRKTNPIWVAGEGGGRGRPTHSTIAQGRLYEECETNPIPPCRRRRTEEFCRTKPNLGGVGNVDKGGCRVGRGSAGE